MKNDGDLRMLGAGDGLAHALVWVRQHIGAINYHPINPRHSRKVKAREAILRPLRELENRIAQSHSQTKAAYQQSREPAALPDCRHTYKPNKRYPWFCGECGYSEHEALKHLPGTVMGQPIANATAPR